MRTNIEIDDTLLAEAMAATGLRTKQKVVEAGLRLLRGTSGTPTPASSSAASDGKAICIASAWMSRTTPITADEGARRNRQIRRAALLRSDRDFDPMTRHLGLRAL